MQAPLLSALVLSDPNNTIGLAITLLNILSTGFAVVGAAYLASKVRQRYKEGAFGLPSKKALNMLGAGLLCAGALWGLVALFDVIIGD